MSVIKQKTLDLLDASLRKDMSRYDSYPYKDRYKIFTHDIRIDPSWCEKKYNEVPKLSWQGPHKFSDMPNFEDIIKGNEIGIYIMYVRPNLLIEDMPQHMMYVGISGEHGSSRPLKDRLKDYFNINKIKLRENIHTMLQLYYENVYIKYALFNGNYLDLEKIEVVLHEFYSPRFGKRDFEPDTKKAQGAWNTGR